MEVARLTALGPSDGVRTRRRLGEGHNSALSYPVVRFTVMGLSESPSDWAPSPHVTARDTSSGAILLDMAGGHCWEMNGTGAKMWNLLMELQSAARAIAKIGEILPDARDRAAEDMAAFVQQLARLGIVVPVPGPPSAFKDKMTPDSSSPDSVRATFADLVRAPHVAAHLADGTLLVVPSTGALLELNATGALIYRGLLNAQSQEVIASALANRFGIPGSRAIADVEALLTKVPTLAPDGAALGDGDSPFRFAASGDGFSVAREGRVCLNIDRDGRTAVVAPQVAMAEAREALLWVTPKLAVLQGIPVLHASAVRLRGGRAIVFAGQSGAGKTTLARALASAGGTLLCEDSCALLLDNPDGAAHLVPFEGTAKRWAQEILTAAEPGLPMSIALPPPDASSATRIDRVLLVDRRRRAGRALVTSPIGPTAATGALMVNLFWAALDQKACSCATTWAVSLAARVTVEELTAPEGLDYLTDAARALASPHGT